MDIKKSEGAFIDYFRKLHEEKLKWKEAQLEFYLMRFSRLEYETRIKDLSEEYTERHHVADCIRLLNLEKRMKREVLRGKV